MILLSLTAYCYSSCLYGGTCIDGINSFHCSCPAGYTDTNCQHLINPWWVTFLFSKTNTSEVLQFDAGLIFFRSKHYNLGFQAVGFWFWTKTKITCVYFHSLPVFLLILRFWLNLALLKVIFFQNLYHFLYRPQCTSFAEIAASYSNTYVLGNQ